MGVRKYDPKKVKFVDVDLDEEAEKWKEKQQADLIIDFDEAVAEERAKAILVKFQGQEYELPRKAPAWLPLFINRHMNESGEIGDQDNLKMIAGLLGKEFADTITSEQNNFVSLDSVNEKILKPVMKKWGFSGFSDTTKKETTPES